MWLLSSFMLPSLIVEETFASRRFSAENEYAPDCSKNLRARARRKTRTGSRALGHPVWLFEVQRDAPR